MPATISSQELVCETYKKTETHSHLKYSFSSCNSKKKNMETEMMIFLFFLLIVLICGLYLIVTKFETRYAVDMIVNASEYSNSLY